MTQSHSIQSWAKFLFFWTASVALSAAAGAFLVLLASNLEMEEDRLVPLVVPLASLLAGLAAGTWQVALLRNHLQVSFAWVWATGLGWAVGLPLVIALSAWVSGFRNGLSSLDALLAFTLGAGLSGLVAGIAQWMVLAPNLPRAGWWLVASAMGWIMAWVATLALAWAWQGEAGFPVAFEQWPAALVLGGVAGLLVGFETGIALVGLFAQRAWDEKRFRRDSYLP